MTINGLTVNGVDVPWIGSKALGKHVLRAGLQPTAHAQSQIPYDMGGSRWAPRRQMDRHAVQFISQANLLSPVGFKMRRSHDEHTWIMRFPDEAEGGIIVAV